MFQHLLVIVRFSSRVYGPTIYIVHARDGEISTSGLYCIICNFYIQNMVVWIHWIIPLWTKKFQKHAALNTLELSYAEY